MTLTSQYPNQALRFICIVATLLTANAITERVSAEQPVIEVRTVHLRSEAKATQFDRMMKDGAMRVLHDAGIENVGVFQLADPKTADTVPRVLVVEYPSLEVFWSHGEGYVNAEFWEVAQDYLMQDKDDPAFTRIESSLLKPFSGMPHLSVPAPSTTEGSNDTPRLFELRTYESYSEIKGKLKVQMFNDGEIDLFKKVRLDAVFYGETIVGGNMPCLTYMLVHADEEAMKAAWSRFLNSPEWEEMKKIERYDDTVSKIIKTMLVPTDYSDIK